MVAADGEADLAVCFEAPRGREEAEGGRAEGVFWWEDDAAMVDAVGVGAAGARGAGGGGIGDGGGVRICRGRGGGIGAWGAPEGEVPFEEVVFERDGGVVGRGVGG